MIQIKRLIPAPRKRVFELWTRPDEIKKWWILDGYSTASVEMDLRIGGSYRIGMKPEEGPTIYISGIFNEVDGRDKIVYTWTSEEVEDLIKDTRVSVEFRDQGASTEIILTHEFLRTQLQDSYKKGWIELIEHLRALCR